MISKYIDNIELKRVIEEGNIKSFRVKKILRNQGIVLVSNNQEELAKQIYPIIWGCVDITEMKNSIDDDCNYIKSSLIELHCSVEKDEDVMDIVEEFFNTASYSNNKFSIKKITRANDNGLTMEFDYLVKRVGRNILLTSQHRMVDVTLTKKNENKVLMELRQVSAFDLKDINNFLDKATNKRKDLTVSHISLKKLTRENKVEFFDKFNGREFKDWRFTTVTRVEVKKDIEDEQEKEITEEGDVEALNNLHGITSAILSGTSIRDNSFIQECLKGQFSISNMGYKFESINDLLEVVIEINFKYDDIKIDICKTFEYDETEQRSRPHPLIMSKQEEIIKMFQDAAYRIYNELLDIQIKELSPAEK